MLEQLLIKYKETRKDKDLAKLRDEVMLVSNKILYHLKVSNKYLRENIINEMVVEFYINVDNIYIKNLQSYLYTMIIHNLYNYRKKDKEKYNIPIYNQSISLHKSGDIDFESAIKEILSKANCNKDILKKILFSQKYITEIIKEDDNISFYDIKKVYNEIRYVINKQLF